VLWVFMSTGSFYYRNNLIIYIDLKHCR